MTVTIPIKNIQPEPGSIITLNEINWEQFEAILAERQAERIRTKIAYSKGMLTIMSPLAAHERPHRIIGDIVKVLLDSQERDWEDFGSTTFRKKAKQAGLEPDTCFYIENAQKMRGCLKVDLTVDPPPDLAIETDITSKTTLEAYEALEVPELWIYTEDKLRLYVLRDGKYIESVISNVFPGLPIPELIPGLVKQAFTEGSRKMLKELRNSFR
jgi:Uma2 family endonuclease